MLVSLRKKEIITNQLKLIAKTIDNFHFIVYYYHIVNEKHQMKCKKLCRDVGPLLAVGLEGGFLMSHNFFLREQCISEQVQAMQTELRQSHELARAGASNETMHHNLGRHLIGKLGTSLVALGTRLERIDSVDHPDRSLATSH